MTVRFADPKHDVEGRPTDKRPPLTGLVQRRPEIDTLTGRRSDASLMLSVSTKNAFVPVDRRVSRFKTMDLKPDSGVEVHRIIIGLSFYDCVRMLCHQMSYERLADALAPF